HHLGNGILAGERADELLDGAKLILGVGHPAAVALCRRAGPHDAELGSEALPEPGDGLLGRASKLAGIDDLDADRKGVASGPPAPTRPPGLPGNAIKCHELCHAAVALNHDVGREAFAFGSRNQATALPLVSRPAVSCSTIIVGSMRPPWFGVGAKGAAFPAI